MFAFPDPIRIVPRFAAATPLVSSVKIVVAPRLFVRYIRSDVAGVQPLHLSLSLTEFCRLIGRLCCICRQHRQWHVWLPTIADLALMMSFVSSLI